MKLSVFRTGIAENTGLNLSAETVSLGVIAIPNVQCIGGRITMADLYFRCGSKSEADSLIESAREFAEKHEMSIEHVIFDRQDGRTIMLNMYADSAVYREPTTLLVRNYACLGNSEIQRLTMHKKLVRNGLTVVFEGGSPIADPAESVVVRKIFEMYRHGTGVIEIAKEANRLLADIRNENGQNTADAKPLTRHNVYAMVENNRYFGIEEKDGFAPYPAIVPNYLRLYAARINRQRKEKAEAGHRFMFANILPVGLGTVLQTVNIASPYKPEIRFYCENGKIIVDAVRFENAIYDALWMQLRNGSERMERAVRRYIAENRKTAEATRNDVYSRLEMIREEINRIGENGWSESIMPHMNRAGCFDDFKTAYDELREEFRCAQLECELLGVTGVQISGFFAHAADIPIQCAEEIRFFSSVFIKNILIDEERITIKTLGEEWGDASMPSNGIVRFAKNQLNHSDTERFDSDCENAQCSTVDETVHNVTG